MILSTKIELANSSEWHEHHIIEIIFCRSGSGLLVLDQHEIDLVSRRAIIIAPGVRHRFLFRGDESADLKIVCMTQADATLNLSAAQSAVLGQVRIKEAAFTDYTESDLWLWELVDQIPDTLKGEERGNSVMTWGLIGTLVASFVHRMEICLEEFGSKHSYKIRDVCAWIDANLNQLENLDALASRFGMSKTLLTREFRRYTSTSIVNYVNSRRLQSAGAALMSSRKSILEVSLDQGFASLANFYKEFKALYGITPNEFRSHLTDNFGSQVA